MASTRFLVPALTIFVALQTLAYAKVPTPPALNNGPGIVVCEPVTKNKDLANFSAGCGLWLEYEVAGQPAFGKSPSWVNLPNAVGEVGHTDLRLTLIDMPNFVRALGPTHVALGTCTGTPQHAQLIYQLYTASPLRRLGRAITITGTEASIVNQLPRVAAEISSEVMPGSATIPHLVGATPHQLAIIGQLQFDYLSDNLVAPILAMAKTVPLASVIAVEFGLPYDDDLAELHVARALLNNCPTNPLVLDVISHASTRPRTLAPAIAIVLRTHPDNYMIADADYVAQVHNLLRPNDLPQRVSLKNETELNSTAIHAGRCAPLNPNAMRVIGYWASNEAYAIRRGAPWDRLNAHDAAHVTRLYSIAYQASLKSVQMDPLCEASWKDLAKDAAIDKHMDVANHAFEMSVKLDPQDADYGWGIELFSPKWQNNPSGFARAAGLATDAPVYGREKLELAKDLADAGFNKDSVALLASVRKFANGRHNDAPNDQISREAAVEISVESGNQKQAAAAALELEKMFPKSATRHIQRGEMLDVKGEADEYMAAFKLRPDDAALECLAVTCELNAGPYPLAKVSQWTAMLNDALSIDPMLANAHSDLALLGDGSRQSLSEAEKLWR